MSSLSSFLDLPEAERGRRNPKRSHKSPLDWFTNSGYRSTSPVPLERRHDKDASRKESEANDRRSEIEAIIRETGDSAAWRLYNKAAKEVDERLVKDWNSKLGGILLFAALFASVVTTLLVDTMTLLEPSNLDRSEALLYFLAMQTVSPVDVMPVELRPGYVGPVYKQPRWAYAINGLLIASLSFSVLVGMGAIICLEWINEYDAGTSAIYTPKKQALRRHYRFKYVKIWYMPRLISALPLMMFIVVVLFFVAFLLWISRVDRSLGMIPVTGIVITAGLHFLTTTLSVVYPSAPFKTSISYAIFKVTTYMGISKRFLITVIPIWWRFWLDRLKGGLRNKTPDVVRRSYATNWAKSTHEWKNKVHEVYPWLPRGLQLSEAITIDRREDAVVRRNITLRLSALAWIASSLDISFASYPDFVHILKEINKLDKGELQGWGTFEYEAPWGKIFRLVLACSSAEHPTGPRATEMETILAELLEKMLVNQTLFFRIIKKVNQPLLTNVFIEHLAANKAAPEDNDHRLRGMTILLSSLNTQSRPKVEWPLRGIFRAIEDSMQNRGDRTDAHFNSWIFPLCSHDEIECDIHDSLWPDDNYVDFIDSFSGRRCRVDAIFRFMQLINSTKKESDTTPEDLKLMFRLLIDHILAIHWTFETPPYSLRDPRPRFIDPSFEDPALDLISSTMIHPYRIVPCPSDWSLPWQYAVKYWCRWKRLVGSGFSRDNAHSEIDFLCKIWEQDLDDDSVFKESINMLDGRTSLLLPQDWNQIFENLTDVAKFDSTKLTLVLGLFEQALQSPAAGPTFAQKLRSRVTIRGRRPRLKDSPAAGNLLLAPPGPSIASTPQYLRPGSVQGTGRRDRSLTPTPTSPGDWFRPASLLELVAQSLGTYVQGDDTQRSLRAVCVRIIRRLIPLEMYLNPEDMSLLGDVQSHLKASAKDNDRDAQACIYEIHQKMQNVLSPNPAKGVKIQDPPQVYIIPSYASTPGRGGDYPPYGSTQGSSSRLESQDPAFPSNGVAMQYLTPFEPPSSRG